MSDEAGFDRIDKGIANIKERLSSLESGQTEFVRTVTGTEGRLKVEITREAMRDDSKLLVERLMALNAAIERSADRVIAYIDERISPIAQAVRHLSR